MKDGAGGSEVRPRPVPEALRAAAAARSAPVRPLLAPGPRAVAALALGAAVVAVAVAAKGIRPDAEALGPLAVWTPAALRWVAAAWLIVLAMREGSPSEGAPSGVRTAALALVPLLLAGSADLVARAGGVPPGGLRPLVCYPETIALAIPATALVAWLLARAYPLHATFAAVAGSVGTGLLAEAILHLTCPATSRAHTILIHGGAVVTLGVLAAVVAWLLKRRRARRLT